MTTLLDIVIALLKGNRRKYRLFIICNVLSIGILFSLRLLLDNSSINDASIVDPMISSNVISSSYVQSVQKGSNINISKKKECFKSHQSKPLRTLSL